MKEDFMDTPEEVRDKLYENLKKIKMVDYSQTPSSQPEKNAEWIIEEGKKAIREKLERR